MQTKHQIMYEETMRYIVHTEIHNAINNAMSQLKVTHCQREVPGGVMLETIVTFMGRSVSNSNIYIPNGGKNV